MFIYLLSSLILISSSPLSRTLDESLPPYMLFWNLENFFDYKDSGKGESDKEFSSFGGRHWSKKKFFAKCRAVAKSILWVGEQYGSLPGLIGLAEIENRFVLERLINDTALRKLDYGIVHYESSDSRGIDVALLYRKSEFKLVESRPYKVAAGKDSVFIKTRDILSARFHILNPAQGQVESIRVLVNHHPSKFGGKASAKKREMAIEKLAAIKDSLYSAGERAIIAAGDFNDTPDKSLFQILTNNKDTFPGLINKAAALAKAKEGTIKFNGKWELIDMFFVSTDLEASEMKILYLPFLMTKDKAHAGIKPLRTYSGPRFIGGVSDHCPILLEIKTRE